MSDMNEETSCPAGKALLDQDLNPHRSLILVYTTVFETIPLPADWLEMKERQSRSSLKLAGLSYLTKILLATSERFSSNQSTTPEVISYSFMSPLADPLEFSAPALIKGRGWSTLFCSCIQVLTLMYHASPYAILLLIRIGIQHFHLK